MKRFWILLAFIGLVLFSFDAKIHAFKHFNAKDDEVVFSRNLKGNWDIWTYNIKTKELQQITNTPEDENNPIWIKNKRSIAFIRNGNIYLFSNGKVKQLTSEGVYRYIAYDGKHNRIIFSKFNEEEAELGFLKLANGKEDILFSKSHQQIHACVSTDEKMIYFVEGYLEKNKVIQEIWSFDERLQRFDLLYKEEDKPFFRPDLSPNGDELVFVTSDRDTMSLCLGNGINGKYREIVATKAWFVDYPCWSSDGQKILYTTLVNIRQKLAIYDVKSNSVQTLEIEGECKEGKW